MEWCRFPMDKDSPKEVEEFVLKIGDLPVTPRVAHRLLRALEDPNVSIDRIEELIETDPALVARVLRIANSPFYGYGGRIKTLNEAVIILGFKTLRSILLAASLKGIYKRFGLTEKLIWEHSFFTALYSRLIASEGNPSYAEDAFVAGILHNVGMVVMNNECPDEFHKVIEMFYNNGIAFLEAEEEVFGFNHIEVGALVVKRWRFPEYLEKVIRYHDEPERFRGEDPYLYTLTSAVYNGNRLCYITGVGFGSRGRGCGSPLRLDMEGDRIAPLVGKAEELREQVRSEELL